ncbi:hypothetical protein P9112_014075 [Eukaryota sp. TZLM1-RC]
MGLSERIAEIQAEMARTQRNKATESHLCRLKARLAQLRSELIESNAKSSAGGKGSGFAVEKTGDVRVALLGFPSVGKSSLLNLLTETKSEVSEQDFCTLTCIPGNLIYNDVHIQLLDLPGIIEGAASGRGRGKEVLSVIRSADLCLMMVESDKAELQVDLLTKEVEAMGIRLNQQPPDITVRQTKTGGIKLTQGVPLTRITQKDVVSVLHSYKIMNAEVLFREDLGVDSLIDVVAKNRIYMPCIYTFNKVDNIVIEETNRLASKPYWVPISCAYNLNLDRLLLSLWKALSIVRVYTKKKGCPPDFTEPIVLRKGGTVKNLCRYIHSTMEERFKYAIVYGASAKHKGQRVGLAHQLCDEDVVSIFAR